MTARGLLILTAFTAAALAVLVGLGAWQLQRLHWKEGLIAAIETRSKAPPVELDEALARMKRGEDVEYTHVAATGIFNHEMERYLYATDEDGAVGWHVIAPLVTPSGETVLVDRGFVPDALRNPSSRREGEVVGTVTITGLARASEKQRAFVPDNDPVRNQWFWRDLDGMAKSMDVTGDVLPFFIDAEDGATSGLWPRGGQTRLDLPNDHLQYAITWFLLALSLVVIYALYVWSRLRGREVGRDQVAGKGEGR